MALFKAEFFFFFLEKRYGISIKSNVMQVD